MSFLKKVGGAIKEAANNAQQQRDRQNARIKSKKAILDRLTMPQLKALCKEMGIAEPLDHTVDFLTGKKEKRVVERGHYTEQIDAKLKLEQIVGFCQRSGIPISDLLPGARQGVPPKPPAAKPSPPSAAPPPKSPTPAARPAQATPARPSRPSLAWILDDIRDNFPPQPVRDENDFEKQLFQYLNVRYKNKASRQVPTTHGKVDIVLFDSVALELKIAKTKATMRNLIGQIHDYKQVYREIAVVILDVGQIPRSDLEHYRESFAAQGAPMLVIPGTLQAKRGRKGTTIRIN